MNSSSVTLNPDQTQAVLNDVLREVHGPDARLENWTAAPLSKRGKCRAVRYEVNARVAGEPQACRHQWVGKFYESDADARKVATTLRELAGVGSRARGGLVIPCVLAYHAPLRLLLFAYESGESVIAALGRHDASVLAAIGRALAALHSAPVTGGGITSVSAVLGGLRRRVAYLCGRFPGERFFLLRMLNELQRQAPCGPAAPSFLHGDLGPAQLLWQTGRIVVLDFDRCTRGDAALDLGNLLTQLRRLTLRKPGKLPEFPLLRWGILDAYQRWSQPDPGLAERVAWYEQVILLRKIQFLTSNTDRHKGAEAMRRRQAEAIGLLRELPALVL